jgi:hypothetical protein
MISAGYEFLAPQAAFNLWTGAIQLRVLHELKTRPSVLILTSDFCPKSTTGQGNRRSCVLQDQADE